MITEDQLCAYLAGEYRGAEKRRFENELAETPEMLRALVEQEKFEAALTMMLARPERERLKASILEVARGPAGADLKSRLYERIEKENKRKTIPRRAGFETPSWLDWLKMCPRPIWMTAVAAFALLVAYIVFPLSRDSRMAGGKFVPPFKYPEKRQGPLEQPFAPDSPWNTPVRSHARYAEPVGLDLSLGAAIVDAEGAHPVFYAAPGDPIGEIRVNGSSTPVDRLPLPMNEIPDRMGKFAVVSPDGEWIYDILNGRREPDGIRAGKVVKARLDGSGVPPDYRAPTLSGLSEYSGSLCAADFRGPIRRALGAVFDPSALAKRPDGSLHVWPVDRPDELPARYAAEIRREGNIQMGTRLAIPPDVDIANIGVGDSGPAYEVAKALQVYGVYLKHPYDGNIPGTLEGGRRAPIIFCGDLSGSNLPASFREQLARVATFLKVAETGPADAR
ncbi:MAG: hypothetical protein ISQ14_14980 [Verrucomicrobiae bacterium]|nr:hypothetical protein [Verrucomicrobiae bacterium]